MCGLLGDISIATKDCVIVDGHTRLGVAAGSYVLNGVIQRGARARLVRDGRIVWEGRIDTLRRFKDDVREVAEGFECGIGLENFQDIHEGDVIEDFEVREVARSL